MKRIHSPKQKLKNLLNKTIKELQRFEKDYDIVESYESNNSFSNLSGEHFDFIEMMTKSYKVGDIIKHQRYFMAYNEDSKSVNGIVDKVLKHSKKDK